MFCKYRLFFPHPPFSLSVYRVSQYFVQRPVVLRGHCVYNDNRTLVTNPEYTTKTKKTGDGGY